MDYSHAIPAQISAEDRAVRFRTLLDPVYPAIRRYAGTLARSEEDAEDLLQESLMRAWSNIGRLRDDTRFKYWVLKIIRHVYLLNARTRTRRTTLCPVQPSGDGMIDPALWCHTPATLTMMELRQALAELDPSDRTALLLSVLGGATVEELSTWSACGTECMKKRMERIRKKVRNYLHKGPGNDMRKFLLSDDIVSETLALVESMYSRSDEREINPWPRPEPVKKMHVARTSGTVSR